MQVVQKQKEWFKEGHTKSFTFRKEMLKRMKKMLTTFEKPILNALQFDLNKSEYEAYASEIAFLKAEIDFHIVRMGEWIRTVEFFNGGRDRLHQIFFHFFMNK